MKNFIYQYAKDNIVAEEWYKVEQCLFSFWNDCYNSKIMNYTEFENTHETLLYLQSLTIGVVDNVGLVDWFKEYADKVYEVYAYLDAMFVKYTLTMNDSVNDKGIKLLDLFEIDYSSIKENAQKKA